MTLRSGLLAAFAALLLAPLAPRALAVTAHDLRPRFTIDGSTSDFTADEVVFGLTATGDPEEREDDSVWGPYEDVRQIRITWDHRRLYVAVEATIWDNNVVIALDPIKDRGLADMAALNSWRRNFYFTSEFLPDLFGATWDTNTAPRLLLHLTGTTVSDNLPGTLFQGSATFHQGETGHAMELAIPWSTVFPGLTRDTLVDVGGSLDTATVIPALTELRLAAFVTGGPDGVSGPDSAPNNLGGHPTDFLLPVSIDNFAIVALDEDGDGLADTGVFPRSRVRFHDVSTPVKPTTWGRLKATYR